MAASTALLGNVAAQVSLQRTNVEVSASSGSPVGLTARRHARLGFSTSSFAASCKQLRVESASGVCRKQFAVRAAQAEMKTQAKVTKKCFFDIAFFIWRTPRQPTEAEQRRLSRRNSSRSLGETPSLHRRRKAATEMGDKRASERR